jgi:class 3 adenylate cyclase
MDSEMKSNLADSAFRISQKDEDACRQIYARVIQATHLDKMAMSDSALTQLYWASREFNAECDSNILMSVFANFTNIYLSLGEFNRIDSVSRIALAMWNPTWEKKDFRFILLNNFAIAQSLNGDTIAGETMFRQALREAISDTNDVYIQQTLINMGTIKGMRGDLDSAYYYFNEAAIHAKDNPDISNFIGQLISLANLDKEMGRYKNASALLDSAFMLAEERKFSEYMAMVQNARADLYARRGMFENAYDYLRDYIGREEQYLNEERVKAVTEMMEKYESEKKARQIQKLELDNMDAALKNEQITHARNRYLFFGIALFLIAVGIWTRLRYIHKSRAIIQKEKDISEGLLLNILPAEVAEELKTKGKSDAKHFDLATILFSDFKSFTSIAEKLSPTELVEEINYCFKAFDGIMTKYGIEKIKTIGDAYMAAGAIPHMNTATALDVVYAALEMQEVIEARKKERTQNHMPAFEMRLGINSGPVVAGIVGVKKFQYDIWGDAVNIASRLETSGEVGKVNISQSTYDIVKDVPELIFTSRGVVDAKGKGALQMYFVERM